MSQLSGGAALSASQDALGVKYVGSGTEIYRYGGRTYPVSEGQFLIVPRFSPGEVEVRSTDARNTWGLCLRIPSSLLGAEAGHGLEEPMIFGANLSPLGRMLSGTLLAMKTSEHRRGGLAEGLFGTIARDLEDCVEQATRSLDGVQAKKRSTRYEILRRLNIARAHLHDVTDRPVDLDELARVSGLSKFHLLRNFRDGFGHAPAAYHRRLRLEQARRDVLAGQSTCSAAAHRFGFADASSMSHAHRREFGRPITASPAGTHDD